MPDKPSTNVNLQTPPAIVGRLVNPLFKRLLLSPLHRGLSKELMMVSFQGRKTSTPYRVVVAYAEEAAGGDILTFSHATWRVNFRGGHGATVRLRGSDITVQGALEEDPALVAAASLAQIHRRGGSGRNIGVLVPKTVKPTVADLAALSPPHSFIRFTRR